MLGQTLGHYRIESKLGEGGMGVVYRAHDIHLDRAVAIKVLPAEVVADPSRKKRFVNEARVASALNHPNICHIYDIDQSGGVHFIAMEFVPGKTLDQLIGGKGLPLAEAVDYALQIVSALARAHAAGVVHRDIKPPNIMVTPEGLVKVLDFGLAKLSEPEKAIGEAEPTETVRYASPRTEEGTILGTVAYMSPEQADGKPADARSDIFSFGSLLYEMTTGQLPFRGSSRLRTLSAILHQEPKPPSEMLATAPSELDRIVARCLRKEPEARFQLMSDLQVELEGLRQIVRAPSSAGAGPSKPAPRLLRRKWLWGAAGTAAAAAVAVFLGPRLQTGTPPAKLIAILPFRADAADPFAQAICDGLVDTLSRRLSWLNRFQPGVRVLPQPEVRTPRSPAEVGKEWGAALALTGSVKLSNAGVHWAAALINTATVREVKRLEADLPPGVSPETLRRFAGLLGFRLPPEAQPLLTAGATANREAQALYFEAVGLARSTIAADIDRSISLFQRALEMDRAYGLAHASLAEAFWAKNKLARDQQYVEKARQSCLRAIAVGADFPEVHVLMGNVHTGTGQPQQAVPEFERALQLDPMSYQASSGLGRAHEAAGRLQEAEAAFRRMIELWPNYHNSYSAMGAFYVRQARYQDGVQPFRKVIALVPDSPVGYSNLGAVYHYLDRADEAAAMMKKAIAIRPNARYYSNLGTFYFFQGRYADSVPLMEKAVEMDDKNDLYWGNLGDAYRWTPESRFKAPEAYKRAIALAEPQLAMNPNDAALRARLAVYYTKLPDNATALDEIAQARRLAPMDATVLFKAAMVYEITGRRDQAIGALDLAIQAGYSKVEIRREPEFAELRKDSGYQRLDQAAIPRTARKPAQ